MHRALQVWVVLAIGLNAAICPAQQARQQAKRIPVSFAVESERPQGLLAQSLKDLDKGQLQKLEQVVRTEISSQQDVTLVDVNDPNDHLHVAVVAAQLEHSGAANWIVVSSVVTIAEKKGSDVLATHDVMAGATLSSVANSVGFQLASIKFRLMLGITK